MECPRITGKDYEQAGTTPILNIMADELRDLYGYGLFGKTNLNRVHLLHKVNIDEFKSFWGRQSVCWTGWERNWVWKHEFENCDLYVMSAPERGTRYEVAIHGNKAAAKIEVKSFLKRLIYNMEH